MLDPWFRDLVCHVNTDKVFSFSVTELVVYLFPVHPVMGKKPPGGVL